eukprot:1050582-Prorocentrum_minimum.AAC.2
MRSFTLITGASSPMTEISVVSRGSDSNQPALITRTSPPSAHPCQSPLMRRRRIAQYTHEYNCVTYMLHYAITCSGYQKCLENCYMLVCSMSQTLTAVFGTNPVVWSQLEVFPTPYFHVAF